jgi:hypothetical protein
MRKRRASLRQIVLHVEECAEALQAKVKAMEDGSEKVCDLKHSAEFLMSGIAFLKQTCQAQRR